MKQGLKKTNVHPYVLSTRQLQICVNRIIDVSCRIKEVASFVNNHGSVNYMK